eukprot:7223-Heterococcus_DN1.PRE.2
MQHLNTLKPCLPHTATTSRSNHSERVHTPYTNSSTAVALQALCSTSERIQFLKEWLASKLSLIFMLAPCPTCLKYITRDSVQQHVKGKSITSVCACSQ